MNIKKTSVKCCIPTYRVSSLQLGQSQAVAKMAQVTMNVLLRNLEEIFLEMKNIQILEQFSQCYFNLKYSGTFFVMKICERSVIESIIVPTFWF